MNINEKLERLKKELAEIVSQIKALQLLRKRKYNHIAQIQWQARKKSITNKDI